MDASCISNVSLDLLAALDISKKRETGFKRSLRGSVQDRRGYTLGTQISRSINDLQYHSMILTSEQRFPGILTCR